MQVSAQNFFQEEDFKQRYEEFNSSEDEVKSKYRSSEVFVAKTSLSEKMQRVFNIAMGFLFTAKLAFPYTTVFFPSLVAKVTLFVTNCITHVAVLTGIQVATLIAISKIALSILVTYAIFHVVRKIVAIAIGHIVYLATLISYGMKFTGSLEKERKEQYRGLKNSGYIVKRITFQKSGVSYDAFVIGQKGDIHNKKWCINAFGNAMVGEKFLMATAERNSERGLNTLIVNGPSVGRSGGYPSAYQMGSAVEAGMQFLEKRVKAKKIVLNGLSLGGGACGKAVLQHDFSYADKKNISYMVISQVSFDRLSNAAGKMVFSPVKFLLKGLGCELDGVKAAKRLRERNITHVVIQKGSYNEGQSLQDIDFSGDDGVIPGEASLAKGMIDAGIDDIKRVKYLTSPKIKHNSCLPQDIQYELDENIDSFLQ